MSRNVHKLYDHPAPPGTGTAVLYLRVSTREQAEMGGGEGYSLPAQREACQRKAESLGATIIGEFAERGESGTSLTNRPELAKLIERVESEPIDYVIVHKIDRLARSRADDAMITLRLQQAGVRLISCTESIDETPSGMLLHGIMSSIAEFYSRNLAAEVVKGSTQKAKGGGTVTKAPLGYRNVRQVVDGQEIRTVEIDPERAPLMVRAFEEYATGEWTIRELLEDLTARGLTTLPGPRTPSKPVSRGQFHRCLRNPYYKGIVRYSGQAYEGAHEPLVSAELWDTVQAQLDARDHAQVKERKHNHYLKGSVYCGQCGSRLVISNSRSHTGTIYPYFICIGRQNKRTNCDQKAILIEKAERAIENHYARLQLKPEEAEAVREFLSAELAASQRLASAEATRQRERTQRLEQERRKLLETYYADAIPLDLFKTEQDRITAELDQAERTLRTTEGRAEQIEANLVRTLAMLPDIQAAYIEGSESVRRQYNQAFFIRIEIDDEYAVTSELAGPWDVYLESDVRRRALELSEREPDPQNAERRQPLIGVTAGTDPDPSGQGLNMDWLVGEGGLEPP